MEGTSLTSLRFVVEIPGISFTGYCGVGGLESTARAPRRGTARKPTFGNLVLRRAADGRKDLWQWYQRVLDGRDDRRDCSIRVLDENGEVALHVEVLGARPCRFALSPLDALQPAVLIEEIELRVRRFTIR